MVRQKELECTTDDKLSESLKDRRVCDKKKLILIIAVYQLEAISL